MAEPDFSARRPVWQTRAIVAGLTVGFALMLYFGRGGGVTPWPGLAVSIGLGAALLVLSWIDLDRFLLLDAITLPLIVAGLLHAVLVRGFVWEAVAGAIIGYLLIAGLAAFWRRRFGREGIGLGDAKLLAAGGAWAGGFALPVILLVASGSMLALTLVLHLFGKPAGSRTVLPFGPALALGIWAVWCVPALVT